MTEAEAEIAALRAEVAQLRAEVAMLAQPQAANVDMGGGEGCDIGLPLVPLGGGMGKEGAFRIEDGRIKDPHFQFGRRVYTVGEYYLPEALTHEATYYLKIDHGNIRAATVAQLAPYEIETPTHTLIPLFKLDRWGDIEADYRGMPVIPVRE